MSMSRRTLVQAAGLGALTSAGLTGCAGRRRGGLRGRGRRQRTTNPSPDPLKEPNAELKFGSIGSTYGPASRYEDQISAAIKEAVIDINAQWQGIFGNKIHESDRRLLDGPGTDFEKLVAKLTEEGVTAVVSSMNDEDLLEALPLLVEANIAVIDVFSSAMELRSPEVQSQGMLIRLSPNDRAWAQMHMEAAFNTGSDRAGAPGTVAFISEDTMQGHSLREQLRLALEPRAGSIVAEHFYAIGDFGDRGAVVQSVYEAHPALVIFNGPAPEAGPFFSDLWIASLDEEKSSPERETKGRVCPSGTVDYRDSELAAKCLSPVVGCEPGGELSNQHINMMLNRDLNLASSGYAYSQQAYDAVALICTAAYNQLSIEGPDIARGVPAVLNGDEDCSDFDQCRTVMRDSLKQTGERATVSYLGRMGDLVLGDDLDPIKGGIREYSWNDGNVLLEPSNGDYELVV